jgi:hypothetical protein
MVSKQHRVQAHMQRFTACAVHVDKLVPLSMLLMLSIRFMRT